MDKIATSLLGAIDEFRRGLLDITAEHGLRDREGIITVEVSHATYTALQYHYGGIGVIPSPSKEISIEIYGIKFKPAQPARDPRTYQLGPFRGFTE